MDDLILNGAYYTHFLNSAQFPYTDDERRCIESTVLNLEKFKTQGDHPGMLLGKIQSGKTKTFMAIMGLAFDNGYDVSVILTKGTKALSKQTQERVRSEFKPFCNQDDVLVFDIMHMPTELVGYELKKKIILVVKKQKDNLDRLVQLFSTKYPELAQKKVLLIDDEADYASVGFKRQKGEVDANLTAVKLEELRGYVGLAAFLQVTATPYALYLQPENTEIRGETFKPVKPAFTELVPVNKAYIGSDYYFADVEEENTVVSHLYHPLSLSELVALKKPDGRRFKLEDVLSSNAIKGLRKAFLNFLVGGAIRQLQAKHANEGNQKFSFLIHTDVSKATHQWQEQVVQELSVQLKDAANDSSKLFTALVKEAYDELAHSVILAGYFMPPFSSVLERSRQALVDGELLITTVNSEKEIESLLDETGQLKLRTPLNIFIGGQILDRGITIGRLIGFYYGRRPARYQQDTVLQHSRMYGYRSKEDLSVTRFYTEPAIYNAMRSMHESDVALREAIEKNPEQGVVFIQKAKDGSVIPCSPNKILLTETTTLKPHKRLLPVGFQTTTKGKTRAITDKIDTLLALLHPTGAGKEPFKIPTSKAHELLSLIEEVLLMEEEDGYSFDWQSLHSAIDYLDKRSPDPGQIWCLWLTDRNNSRLASKGSHTKYVATPDTATTEGRIARDTAKDSPMLMLFRQNGEEERGWKGAPFYWPLIWAPANTPVAIYAHLTNDQQE
ncbi:Z1 domain-containing protein [Shewanella sp. GXUN23E]|uniref:Z1 domain-containing protein n=1 Tax=Shewanella sp. GXUN23E TaxID=3422498 RepID=UPI003D7C8F57